MFHLIPKYIFPQTDGSPYVIDLEVADEVGLAGEVLPVDDQLTAGPGGDVTQAAVLQ